MSAVTKQVSMDKLIQMVLLSDKFQKLAESLFFGHIFRKNGDLPHV